MKAHNEVATSLKLYEVVLYDARDALFFHARVRRGETEFSAYVDYELMNVALYDLFRW